MHAPANTALTFYSVLYDYLTKHGHSPPLAKQLEKLHDASFAFPKTSLDQYVFQYFGAQKVEKEVLRTKICEAAFRDLIPTMNDKEVKKLFQKFQRISDTSSHLFVLILIVDKDFPDCRTVFSNDANLFEQFLFRRKVAGLHVFHE